MHKYTWRTGVLEAVMIAVALIFLIPIYLLVVLSLKKPSDQGFPFALPAAPTFDNFVVAWNVGNLGSALMNSAFITVVTVTLVVVFASSAAYALVRVTSRWSNLVYFVFLAGLLLPAQLGLLPLYQTLRDLGLLGNPLGLILVYVGVQMPFSIFLYAGFLRVLPKDYEEAASLDGAGPVRTFRSVVFPLVRPITGTVIVLNAVFVWNDFLSPLLFLSGSPYPTITVAIYGFVGQYGAQWNLIFAGIIISILPVLIVYFLLQRYIVQGFAGGVKG